MQQQKAAAEC